jgi:thiamine-monophosphate kinase
VPSELQLVEWIRSAVKLPPTTRVALGIGDDCAVYRPRGSAEDLLFTTDFLIENVHFQRETHPARAVGYKALARGLSDIAAMGGRPRFCLLSLGLAPWADDRWIAGFYRGLLGLAGTTDTVLAGGDLARTEHLTCDIVVCGAVPRGSALRRDSARPGDQIYVSGHLGGSALGLQTRRGRAWKRHLSPQPRLSLGVYLRKVLHATAAMDLSDGLSLDLHRLCVASKLGASIIEPPVFPGASVEHALHGGEDYELLFTVPRGTRIPDHFEGVPLHRIGETRRGAPGLVLLNDAPLQPLGYDHFKPHAPARSRARS